MKINVFEGITFLMKWFIPFKNRLFFDLRTREDKEEPIQPMTRLENNLIVHITKL